MNAAGNDSTEHAAAAANRFKAGMVFFAG